MYIKVGSTQTRPPHWELLTSFVGAIELFVLQVPESVPRVRDGDPTTLLMVGANESTMYMYLVYMFSCMCCRAPG